MEKRAPPIWPATADERDDLLIEPLTRLCVELDAVCDRADPLLTRVDHLCEQLPRLLRRVATPW